MNPDLPTTELTLWRSDAVVLFDLLMTVDLGSVPANHPAERQALMDLLTRLEQTDVVGVTQEQIDAARAEVSPEMDWHPAHQPTVATRARQQPGTTSRYEPGDRIAYVAEPVFDLLIKPGDIGVVVRIENDWVVARWPGGAEHSVPLHAVRKERTEHD